MTISCARWHCTICGAVDAVTYDTGLTLTRVKTIAGAQHREYRPGCAAKRADITIAGRTDNPPVALLDLMVLRDQARAIRNQIDCRLKIDGRAPLEDDIDGHFGRWTVELFP